MSSLRIPADSLLRAKGEIAPPSLPPSLPPYLSMSSPPIFSRRTISSKLMSPLSHRSFVYCVGREGGKEGGREEG